MRLQTKSQSPEAVPKPSRTAAPGTCDRQRQAPEGRQPPARRPVRRYVGSSAKSRLRSAPEPRSGGSERGTPPIPLTLRGMQGALRRPPRSSARSFFVLPSVLALLALVLFPVAAHAEESSNEAIYKVAPPTIESPSKNSSEEKSGKSSTGHHKAETNPAAKASGAEGNGGKENSGGAETSAEETESEGQKKSKEESSGSGKNGNPPTTGGGGGNTPQGGGGGGGAGDGVSNGKEVPQQQSGANVSHSTGGSSPVVPILIAVIVLAAISIGVVLYRQRKSGQGPDSRVSSSNAS